jgi:PilZ domain
MPTPDRKPATTTRPALTRPPTAEERRRAQRVLLRMPVLVHFEGKPSLSGFTHTVSQNGAMLIVPEPLTEGTKISLENPKTQKKVEARIVRTATSSSEGCIVPVEFLVAAPHFWNVFFPPTIN